MPRTDDLTRRSRTRTPVRSTDPAVGPEPGPAPTDSFEVLWSAKVWIAAVAVLLAGATYVASALIGPTFESSAVVQVTSPRTSGSGTSDAITASNDLAAQYAQLASTPPVIAIAVSQLGASGAGLSAAVSASTVANQNLVRITSQAPTADAARARADAVAGALRSYVAQQSDDAVAAYSATFAAGLEPLDADIANAEKQVASATRTASAASPGSAAITNLTNAQARLSELVLRRQQALAQRITDEASLRPSVTSLGSAAPGDKVQPKPLLYSLVALLAGAFIAAQVALLRRRRLRR